MAKLRLLTVLLVACTTSATNPSSDRPQVAKSPAPAPAVADASIVALDAPASVESPTDTLAKEAFGGHVPGLPQLSRDGATAAVEASRAIGLSGMSSYEVGIVDRSRRLTRLVVLDRKAAEGVMRTGDSSKIDRAVLAKAAAAVSRRLADGGYAAFPRAIDYDALYSRFRNDTGDVLAVVPIGAAKLQVREPAPDLRLQLVNTKGKAVIDETFRAIPHGKRASDCGGTPHLRQVWIDETKKRVLLHIGYTTGGDICEAPDGFYRLWALP